MIVSKVRKVGNSYVLTLPREEMGRLELHDGDQVAYLPVKVSTTPAIRPALAPYLEHALEVAHEALEYLATR